jgi:serine/threonine protein kinase
MLGYKTCKHYSGGNRLKYCSKCGAEVKEGGRFCPACGAAMPAAPADPLVGLALDGKFLIDKLIGIGGMGRVYKATQLSLDKQVCVKVLHRTMMNDPTLVGRFKREARAASRLSHPNSITVIDFGQASEDGSLYLAMEYVPGKDLSKIIREERPFSEQRVVNIMDQVLSALADAHAAGIVHRDLKPENIMVTDLLGTKDFVKVLDFGIAKIQEGPATDPGLTQIGMVCGTPEYMSPEQARGEELDARCDIYSAGVILYQMVVGRLPFLAPNAMAIVTKHLTESAVPPSKIEGVRVSSALDAVILKAMSKDRKGRQPSALALQQELNAVLSQKVAPGREKPLETNLFDMESIEPAFLENNAPTSYASQTMPKKLSNLKKSSMKWLWIVLAIMAIGGGIGAAYYFMKGTATTDVHQDGGGANAGEIVPIGSGAATGATTAVTPKRIDSGANVVESAEAVPEAAKAFYNLGKELLAQQKIEKACAAFEKAVQKAQNFALGYKALGSCYVQIGQMEKAKKSYQLYLQKSPKAEDAKTIEELLRSL